MTSRSGSTGKGAPLGPRGEKAERLAFRHGELATEIEYDGRPWTFHHTDLLNGPSDNEPKVKRLVYVERRPPEP